VDYNGFEQCASQDLLAIAVEAAGLRTQARRMPPRQATPPQETCEAPPARAVVVPFIEAVPPAGGEGGVIENPPPAGNVLPPAPPPPIPVVSNLAASPEQPSPDVSTDDISIPLSLPLQVMPPLPVEPQQEELDVLPPLPSQKDTDDESETAPLDPVLQEGEIKTEKDNDVISLFSDDDSLNQFTSTTGHSDVLSKQLEMAQAITARQES